MFDLGVSLFAFLVGISLIIGVHEFGHYWVARRCGVKILRFSIGFGRALKTWRRGETEYVIAAIPLGGYVKMLDEEAGEAVSDEDRDRAFNRKPLAARTAIIAAGPAFNFILAILLYAIVFMAGKSDLKPVVHGVVDGSPAMAAGIERGDEIVAINGREVRGWSQVLEALFVDASGEGRSALSLRDASGIERETVLDLSRMNLFADENYDFELKAGLYPWYPPAVVGEVVADGPAGASGLKPDDLMLELAGQAVRSWPDFVRIVRQHPDSAQTLLVERDGATLTLDLPVGSRISDGARVGYAGVGAARRVDPEVLAHHTTVVRDGFFQALARAATTVGDMTLLTLRMIGALIVGEAALTNISGPLTIAQYAGMTFLAGFTAFLTLVALLSLNIGIINLLPIPMLDGGHLVYCLAEFITGSPVSMRLRQYAQYAGLLVVAGIIVIALYSDLYRLFG